MLPAESNFYVEFVVNDEERLAKLTAVVGALKAAKDTGVLAPGQTWRSFFDERSLAHLCSPTEAEPWDFDSLIEAFANGDYRLLGLRRSGELARLEFEPHAHPYGGTDCMVSLVTAFEFRVTAIAD